VALDNEGKSPSPLLAAQYAVADKLVLSKVRTALGLDEAKVKISGAAPVSSEVLEFIAGFGLPVLEVYGQSEDTGPTTINLPGRTRFGSVGPVYPGVEVKIADDGEILVRGRNVFLGYFNDPEATAETLIDGWLHSGDLGKFDAAGMLDITGRKKDIIITAGGKNVAPKPIESGIKNHPLVSEAVLIGDRRKFLSLLVTLDEEAAAAFAEEAGDTAPPHESAAVRDEIQAALDEMNQTFARVEQVKRFAVLPRQLSIEGGELTPTLKVKRNKVADHFAEVIDSMYTD
jgi:long-chain acyl-CoA synthetase